MSEGLPLRDVLSLAPLQQARVVAGGAGLGRLVRYVNVMEVPDILEWVRADQLLLTTAYPLRDERAALSELIPRLAKKGLAGLAIKPARYIDSIPTTMIEAGDRLGFPVVELPPASSFDDIMHAVLTAILSSQTQRLAHSAAVRDHFTRIVLSGVGMRHFAQALARLIAKPVLIVDSQGGILAKSTDAILGDLISGGTWLPQPATEDAVSTQPVRQTILLAGYEWVAAIQPIRVGADQYGAIVVIMDTLELGETELETLQHASTAVALHLVRTKAVAEADARYRALCLEELVISHAIDRSLLRERAVAFGWDLSVPRAVLVATLEEVAGRPFAALVSSTDKMRAQRLLAEAARVKLGDSAIIWERSTGIAALVAPGAGRQAALKKAGTALQAETKRRLGGAAVAVGIGRLYDDPVDLHHSHTEALRAIAIGRRTGFSGQLSLFEEMGLDRLLTSCPSSELTAFSTTVLSQLVAYDQLHRTDLTSTLETFLRCGCNGALAARSLHLHYNSLKHRIERIEQILGFSAADPEQSLCLALAFRIRRLLSP